MRGEGERVSVTTWGSEPFDGVEEIRAQAWSFLEKRGWADLKLVTEEWVGGDERLH